MLNSDILASRDYQESLIESLKDPEKVAAYMSAVFEQEKPEPE